MIQIECPYCKEIMRPKLVGKNKFYEFKSDLFSDAIMTYPRRRKECIKCGKRFNTREIYVPDEICRNPKKRKELIYQTMINIPRK